MKTGLLVLLFVGLMLMTANVATMKNKKTEEKVVYKYLPRDLDTYIREDLTLPSVVHGAMFTEEDIIR